MQEVKNILIGLITNGIGLVLPWIINQIAGKQIIEDKECNWFYGTFILTIAALIICQYTENRLITVSCNLIAGGSAYLAFLCYKSIYDKNQKLTFTQAKDKHKKRKHK